MQRRTLDLRKEKPPKAQIQRRPSPMPDMSQQWHGARKETDVSLTSQRRMEMHLQATHAYRTLHATSPICWRMPVAWEEQICHPGWPRLLEETAAHWLNCARRKHLRTNACAASPFCCTFKRSSTRVFEALSATVAAMCAHCRDMRKNCHAWHISTPDVGPTHI